MSKSRDTKTGLVLQILLLCDVHIVRTINTEFNVTSFAIRCSAGGQDRLPNANGDLLEMVEDDTIPRNRDHVSLEEKEGHPDQEMSSGSIEHALTWRKWTQARAILRARVCS